jgi:DNA polymerase I-like protein with 3'-5' exonuclease and polymerase domains
MISLDTETTGLDLRHGALPYFVTICLEDESTLYWEWDVDPLTRIPIVPEEDLDEILTYLADADEIVLQNAKFDVLALERISPKFLNWPWEKTVDTLFASHLLASNHPHDLTSLGIEYLNVDGAYLEENLRRVTLRCRAIAKRSYPKWRTAKKDEPDMPSVGERTWKNDGWLPRRMAQDQRLPEDHEYWTVLRDYALGDSWTTLSVWKIQKELLKQRGLMSIFEARMKLPKILHYMENHGITISRTRLRKQREQFALEADQYAAKCVRVATELKYDLQLPKSGISKNLNNFVYNVLKLPVLLRTPKHAPALNRATIDHLIAILPDGPHAEFIGEPKQFLMDLKEKRRRDTAVAYMKAYERFWLPSRWGEEWMYLFPSLNATGTDTLRFSSSNPNEQNISKQEGFNLRYAFGPAPGREWWSLDAENIELRIPAYEAGEEDMIRLFEMPLEPPYFGSYHMLIFDLLHPEKFAEHGKKSKNVYASTWYQWTKNGNFAVQYGAIEASGTADLAYHVEGAQARIQGRFRKVAKLNQYWIDRANRTGYVETMPDKSVDPSKGYPLLCTRSHRGEILPTVPLNYHVQGTAMW